MEESEAIKGVRLLETQRAISAGDMSRAWDIYYRRIDFTISETGMVTETRKQHAMFPMIENTPPVDKINWFGE